MSNKNEEYRKTLAENIKYFRKYNCLTQEELAEKIGIETLSLAKIESLSPKTQRLPGMILLFKMSEVLDIPLSLFFTKINNDDELKSLKKLLALKS